MFIEFNDFTQNGSKSIYTWIDLFMWVSFIIWLLQYFISVNVFRDNSTVVYFNVIDVI